MLLKTKAVQLWARRLHIYILMALLLVVLFFSVTGITLNRPELFVNSLPSVSEVELQLTDELMASGSCDYVPDEQMLIEFITQCGDVSGKPSGIEVSATANAHPRWVLPSHFTVSKEGGDGLTFDVTASHGTFVFDKPAGSETAQVVMPDGRKERPNFVIREKRRSMFDFYFQEKGTHKVAINGTPSYYTQYKAGRRDTVKWMKANKAERDELLV